MRPSFTLILFLMITCVTAGSCSDDTNQILDLGSDMMAPDTRKIIHKPFGSACINVGQQCTVKDEDGYDLYCVALAGGPPGKGYCTRTCSAVGTECYGVPNGQNAGCHVGDSQADDTGPGTKYCGFICKTTAGLWDCPPDLTCSKPNAQGTSFCIPKA